jgi:hypothetical protein
MNMMLLEETNCAALQTAGTRSTCKGALLDIPRGALC